MIVVQETDEAILDVLTTALELEDFKVISLLNYEHDFLKLINEAKPHVVMLDYAFDGKQCIKICQAIHEKYPHLPVLALSCNNNINEEYSKYGFDDYIKKPFDLDLLYSVLRKYVPKQKK
ncbi:response regulator [Pedobacter antarcticus]|uniref:response regulator n=1 Tax=Pedobacter antarcticus TaxID=34086 RepID=UPI00088A1539|nr:response regulator [Pedobacter antarcticus]SDM84153.1 Response regulator receiver domain-containing protein [Pedobacter antarcticus]